MPNVEKMNLSHFLELSKVTRQDMAQFHHCDDWGVHCLYLHEAQEPVHQKVMEIW